MKNIGLLFIVFFVLSGCNIAQEKEEISTVELKQLLDKKEIQLIDVRTPQEVEEGFIKTAKFVNYFDDDFLEKVSKIVDKEKVVYLYCRTGNRSEQATQLLKRNGYNVINVTGGYMKWIKEFTNE